MSLASKLLSSSGGVDKLFSDDVFSCYTYTGNGATQTINNGIDLAGKGGLVWGKRRDALGDGMLSDTVRGAVFVSYTDATNRQDSVNPSISAFTASGFSLTNNSTRLNDTGGSYVAWTFRKNPSFFDVVTYTGDGTASRQIAHALGIAAGMVTTKSTSVAGDWNTYHQNATGDLTLNTTAAQTASKAIVPAASATTFTVSGVANTSGTTYVAYLFAHDPSADGIIQCGSYAGSGASGNAVNFGFEPQFFLVKPASTAANWGIYDSARGFYAAPANNSEELDANTSSAASTTAINPTATGINLLTTSLAANQSGVTYIYIAIRRPNKPPTVGTQVYNAIARTGTGGITTVTGVGFAPDLVIPQNRGGRQANFQDRLRGASIYIDTNYFNPETNIGNAITSFNMNGISIGADTDNTVNGTNNLFITQFFKRAPGFFDEVCYTGTGSATTVAHSLGVVPELIIVKGRSGTTQWEVYCAALANTEKLVLNITAAKATDAVAWNSTTPTASTFSVGTGANVNTSAATYVVYLFATLPGISKVGSYTGNGTTQTIPCGFTTGARFLLVKRTDLAGDWFIFDVVRGIVSANDPHLSLNTTAAEITTDDSVDPDVSGFVVNQLAATNINVSAGTYIFLAIA